MNKKLILICLVTLGLTAGTAMAQTSTLANTKHDLSGNISNGPAQICVFCHTPHGDDAATALVGNTPLWNHTLNSAASYTVYDSPTFTNTTDIAAVSPTDSSGLCLSCHDGSAAPDSMYNAPNGTGGTGPDGATVASITLAASANFGTDLANDHPVNFTYANSYTAEGSTGLVPTATVTTDGLLDGAGKVQCSSCHDPHIAGQDTLSGLDFMIVTMEGSQLCLKCHQK